MAITYTECLDARVVANSGGGSGDFTSGAFTTVAGSMLLAVVMVHQGTSTLVGLADTPTPATSGTSWLLAHSVDVVDDFTTLHLYYVADSPGAGSGNTFAMSSANADWDSAVNAIDVVIIEYEGALAAASQPGAVASGSDLSASPRDLNAKSITLDATPDASSYIVASMGVDSEQDASATTPGTGWTELSDRASTVGSSVFLHSQVQTITGHTSTSVDWNDVATLGGAYDLTMGALEILAAGGGPPDIDPPAPRWDYRSAILRR